MTTTTKIDPARSLTDDQIELLIERVAARAADDAVGKAFANLGVNISSPSELRDWYADRVWTRSAREGSRQISMSVKTTLIGTVATAILFAVWQAIQLAGGGQ